MRNLKHIETNSRKYIKYFRKRNTKKLFYLIFKPRSNILLLLQIVYWYILFVNHT